MSVPEPTQEITFHLDAPELKVYSNALLKLMVIQACGVVPTEVYRCGLSLATEVALEEQIFFWLVNNREGGIITPSDQIWANEVNAPLLAKAPFLKKMAFIEPKDVHSKIILEDLMDKARDIFPFEMQFFEDVPAAYSWFLDNAATVLSAAIPLHAVQEDGDTA